MRAEIVQAGGVEALTVVLRTGTEAGQLAAVYALSSLAQEAQPVTVCDGACNRVRWSL